MKKMSSVGAKRFVRVGFVLVAAFGTALLFATLAPNILNALYRAITAYVQRTPATESYQDAYAFMNVLPFALLGAFFGAFLGNLCLRAIDMTREKWDGMDIGDKVTLFIGIFAGLIASLPFLLLFNAISVQPIFVPFFIFGLTLGFASLSVYALHSMEEILPWSRGKVGGKRTGIKILDTNVVIDGRIYDVARTGFLEGQLYVPGFVLEELQYIADSHDALRRQRGRRGLEVLRHLQADFSLEVRVHDKLVAGYEGDVDNRLVRLAKVLGGDIVTNDFNLNRVAALQDVRVLNLNDLALALRPNVLPQETLVLTLTREGNQHGQGIGYLEDGTMVVVENGKPYIGETLEIMVTQVIQTERGKMIFGEVASDESSEAPKRRTHRANS